MHYLWAFIISIIIMFIMIFLTTLYITVHFIRKGKDDKLTIRIKAWFGLINYVVELPILKLAENKFGAEYQAEAESQAMMQEEKKKTFTISDIFSIQYKAQQIVQQIYQINRIIKRMLKAVRLEKLEWYSEIGTGDAAETGILTGTGWGVKSSLVGIMTSYFTLRTVPKIHVQPQFQEKKLETEFLCMIRFRIGHAILTGIRMLINLRKRRDNQWQNTLFRA